MRWTPIAITLVTLVTLTLVGCTQAGDQESTSTILVEEWTPCDLAAEQVVTDFSAPVFALDAVDDLMALLLGQWDVQAMGVEEQDPSGPFPGTFTVELIPGDVVARDLELPANTDHLNPWETCEDEYLIPVRLTLTLDGGLLDFPYENTLRVRSDSFAEINLRDIDGAFWVDPSPLTGSMITDFPLDGGELTDAFLHGEYLDGNWVGGVWIAFETDEYGASAPLVAF